MLCVDAPAELGLAIELGGLDEEWTGDAMATDAGRGWRIKMGLRELSLLSEGAGVEQGA